jgi:hypothetical protein
MQGGPDRGWSLDEIWKVREECIHALSLVAGAP